MQRSDRLARLDLNLLYSFHAFVRTGSLAAASRLLSRSQPAVSARLHQLERELGLVLFEKVGRRLQLTPAGVSVHDDVQQLVGALRDLADKADHLGQRPGGRVSIGALPTVAAYILAAPVAAFARQHPRVEVDLWHELTPELVSGLSEGRLDAAVSIGAPPRGPFEVTVLRQVRPVLAVRRRSALGKKRRAQASDLRAAAYIRYRRIDDAFFAVVDRFLARHRIAEGGLLRASLIQTIKELIMAGAGVSVLPDYTLLERELVGLPIEGLNERLPVWLATRKGARSSPTLSALRSALAGPDPSRSG
jgi:LysR family hydrogen peroxide-inducible transcriptional activator